VVVVVEDHDPSEHLVQLRELQEHVLAVELDEGLQAVDEAALRIQDALHHRLPPICTPPRPPHPNPQTTRYGPRVVSLVVSCCVCRVVWCIPSTTGGDPGAVGSFASLLAVASGTAPVVRFLVLDTSTRCAGQSMVAAAVNKEKAGDDGGWWR
jgi:hypothetical protein